MSSYSSFIIYSPSLILITRASLITIRTETREIIRYTSRQAVEGVGGVVDGGCNENK